MLCLRLCRSLLQFRVHGIASHSLIQTPYGMTLVVLDDSVKNSNIIDYPTKFIAAPDFENFGFLECHDTLHERFSKYKAVNRLNFESLTRNKSARNLIVKWHRSIDSTKKSSAMFYTSLVAALFQRMWMSDSTGSLTASLHSIRCQAWITQACEPSPRLSWLPPIADPLFHLSVFQIDRILACSCRLQPSRVSPRSLLWLRWCNLWPAYLD